MSAAKETRFITGTKNNNNKITFVILSAGQGRRTKNYGNKSLINYNGKSILQHQIDVIRSKYGADADIILVTGFCADKVVREVSGVRIVENPFYDSTNVVESMRVGLNAALKGSVFFIHGDLIFSSSYISPPDTKQICIPVDNLKRFDKAAVGVVTQHNKVVNLSYGIDQKWCQMCYFPDSFFYQLKTFLAKADKKWTSFEFLNFLITKNVDICYFEHNKRSTIKEIVSLRDLT